MILILYVTMIIILASNGSVKIKTNGSNSP